MPESENVRMEMLLDDFIERLRRGETPSIAQYEAANPEYADEIRRTFPSVQMIEKAALRREQQRAMSAASRPPEQLGDFKIIREIGRGGMGVVFEAEQVSLGRHVAVKLLPRHILLESKQLERFEREARTAGKLHHTNIVPVFGVGHDEGYHYYVMQLIDGTGLDHALAQSRADNVSGCFPYLSGFETANESDYWRAIARIGIQASEALAYAHAHGTLHRDIKPANLLVDNQGVVWITDFGLARAVEQEAASQTGGAVGTLRYMAPEQLGGRADFRSDIYSLGLTLYELLAGKPAYDDSDTASLLRKINQAETPRLRKINPHIPRDLETIVAKATSHDPAHRYQSAAELGEDLKRFLEDRPIQARRTSPLERLWRWSRRNPALASWAGVAAMLLVAVAVVAVVGYVRTSRQRARAEASSELAQQALDDIFEQFVPDRIRATSGLASVGEEGGTFDVPIQPVLSNESAALLQHMLLFYDRLAEQGGDNLTLRRKAAEANGRVGDIHQRLGQFERAIAVYAQTLDRYRTLREETPHDATLDAAIARLHNRLGATYWAMGQAEQGHVCHREALKILEAAANSTSVEQRYELARTLYWLGRRPGRESGPGPQEPPPDADRRSADRLGVPPARRADRDSSRADARFGREEREESIRKAAAVLEELVQEHPTTPDYRHLLALCYRDLPPQRSGTGEPLVADEVKKATEILQELSQDFPEVPEYRYDLCETYALAHFRGPGFTSDMYPLAEQRLRMALAIAEALVAEHPNVPDYTASLVHVHQKLAQVLRQTDRRVEAEQSLRKALALQNALVRRFPQVASYRVWTAVIQESLAKLLGNRGEWEEARSMLEESVATLNRLLEEEPESKDLHDLWARSSHTLADVLARLNAHDRH